MVWKCHLEVPLGASSCTSSARTHACMRHAGPSAAQHTQARHVRACHHTSRPQREPPNTQVR